MTSRKRPRMPGLDELIPPRVQAIGSGESPDNVKTTTYLRPDQMELLDDVMRDLKGSGERWVKAANLIRAALDVARDNPEAWTRKVLDNGAG
jgi:hypothetical protein